MMDIERLINNLESEVVNDVGVDKIAEDARKIDEVMNEVLPLALPLNEPVFATAFTMIIDFWCSLNEIDPLQFMKAMIIKLDVAKKMVKAVHDAQKGEDK